MCRQMSAIRNFRIWRGRLLIWQQACEGDITACYSLTGQKSLIGDIFLSEGKAPYALEAVRFSVVKGI